MKTTPPADQLRALGYDTTPAEIRRFQQTYNRLGPERLLAIHGELDRATLAGKFLMRQKRRLKHGEFKLWVAANCEFSYSSAKRYMKIAAWKGRGLSFPSILQAIDCCKPEPEQPRDDRAPDQHGGDA